MNTKLFPALRAATTATAAMASLGAAAHEGHGLAGTHWHATDAVGLLLMGGLIALAVWLGGGRK